MEDEARRTRTDRGMDRLVAFSRRARRLRAPADPEPGAAAHRRDLHRALRGRAPAADRRRHAAQRGLDRLAPRAQRRPGLDPQHRDAHPGPRARRSHAAARTTSTASGEQHHAQVQVDSSGDRWIDDRFPIRYDPAHPSQVDLVNVAEVNPLGSALVAGAAIGAGFAALIMAFAIWRRRRVLADVAASVHDPARAARDLRVRARARHRGVGGRHGQAARLVGRRRPARASSCRSCSATCSASPSRS